MFTGTEVILVMPTQRICIESVIKTTFFERYELNYYHLLDLYRNEALTSALGLNILLTVYSKIQIYYVLYLTGSSFHN